MGEKLSDLQFSEVQSLVATYCAVEMSLALKLKDVEHLLEARRQVARLAIAGRREAELASELGLEARDLLHLAASGPVSVAFMCAGLGDLAAV